MQNSPPKSPAAVHPDQELYTNPETGASEMVIQDGEKIVRFPIETFHGGTFVIGSPGQKPFMTGTVSVENGVLKMRDDALDR